jgi:hypothetical protein
MKNKGIVHILLCSTLIIVGVTKCMHHKNSESKNSESKNIENNEKKNAQRTSKSSHSSQSSSPIRFVRAVSCGGGCMCSGAVRENDESGEHGELLAFNAAKAMHEDDFMKVQQDRDKVITKRLSMLIDQQNLEEALKNEYNK